MGNPSFIKNKVCFVLLSLSFLFPLVGRLPHSPPPPLKGFVRLSDLSTRLTQQFGALYGPQNVQVKKIGKRERGKGKKEGS